MSSKGESVPISSAPSYASQLANSAAVNFLDLPKRVRHMIYSRVLAIPHPLFLFQDLGSPVQAFVPESPGCWTALLYTNQQVYREASAVLYGANRFQFLATTQRQVGVLRSFLDCIGPVNAASLSHLCINFPVVEGIDQSGNVELRDDSLQSLKLLQEKCASLATLETIVHAKNFHVFRKSDDFLREALPLIDGQFRAIGSLRSIIVRVVIPDGVPTTSVKDSMQGLGWMLIPFGGAK